MSSIFTKIVAGEIPSHKIAEDDKYFAFLDINPVKMGHTLVVPKNEQDYIFDLEKDDLAGLFVFAQKISAAIKEAFPCNRIGITVIGLEVPHAHVHLIPIDKLTDMDFTKTKLQPSQEELATAAKAIIDKL